MSTRTKLQKAIYVVINPVVRFFIRMGLTPNAVTIIGLLLNIGVSIIFIIGAEEGNRGDLSYVGWAGALVLFAGVFDMLDGQVARLGNMGTTFGALFDSVLDRYSELILFLGICYYLVGHHYFFSSLFAFIALIGSMMVSYVRARAEGLGIECKGGLMQRPERVITIGVSALACGILSTWMGGDYKLFVPGIRYHVFETMSIFTIPITIMAVLTNITAIRRLYDCRKAMIKPVQNGKVLGSGKLQTCLIVLLTGLGVAAFAQQQGTDSQNFPVPVHTPNQLFYLQRTPNTNTIVCELNFKNGVVDNEEPVHVFWIRYAEKQQKKELSYLQRSFAYGIKSKRLGDGKYELHFVSDKKILFYLEPSPADNKYNIYATIEGKKAVLHRIFIKINEGGSFWSPNIEYVELEGTDALNGSVLLERIKV